MRLGGTIPATLAMLVVTLGFGSAHAAAAQPEPVVPTADIDYTCRNVTVSVEPEWVSYDLVIRYDDTVADREGKALVGPMNGTVTEPFGPEILLTNVEVLVNGATVATGSIPARCYPETSDRTRSGSSASGTDRGAGAVDDRSRNPVPVATATT